MRIDPSLNLHAARAYGVNQPRAAATVQITPPAAGTVAKIEPSRTSGLASLVAGRAVCAVDFTGQVPSSAAFQLYTRAADKVEAAVAVQVGRTIDVHG